MKDNGLMIYNMVLERRAGLMDQFTEVNTLAGKSMVKVYTAGMMVQSMMVNGKKIKSKD